MLVSNWLKNLCGNGFNLVNPSVIMLDQIVRYLIMSIKHYGMFRKISIVTHHWGGNWNRI